MCYDKKSEKIIEQGFSDINDLVQHGLLSQALEVCESLFVRFPKHARVLHGMGLLLFRNGDCEKGIELINKSIQVKPDYADAYYNLSSMMKFYGRFEEEEALLKKVLALNPEHPYALAYHAACLKDKGLWQEAVILCKKSLSIASNNPIALETLGTIFMHIGNVAEAITYYRKALAAGDSAVARSNMIHALHLLPASTQKEIYEETLQWGRQYGPKNQACHHLNSSEASRKIRVGYVSGDLKFHPVSYHLKPVLAAHDRKLVEVYLYSTVPFRDNMTNELVSYSCQYRNISTLSDEHAEKLIRNDGIDILVDLSGHTAYNRLTLFTRKPAPIQLSWIGYFNTTGLKQIDYLVSDPISIPADGDDSLFVEKVLRLPDIRFCYAPPHDTPDVVAPPVMKNGFITFGSFNKLCKINEFVVQLWSKTLHAVPGSKLLLKWALLDDEVIRRGYLDAFAAQGIEADRLIFRPESSYEIMLKEYGDIDIVLDTFPFNGGATTCEALWMGVPVITLEGETPISRQSKAFLYALGRPEWVSTTPDEFVRLATCLAENISVLSQTRKKQREFMMVSTLCDSSRFTHNLENAYRKIWKVWCENKINEKLSHKELLMHEVSELYNAGVDAMSYSDYRWAVQLFKTVIKRSPENADAINNLGGCLFKLHCIPEAIKAFKKAIRCNSGFGKAYSNLGRIYLETKQPKKALGMCLRAVDLLPGQLDVLVDLGYAYSRINGKRCLALNTFERVLELDKNNVHAMLLMANILAAKGDVPAALALLQKVLKIDPQNIRAFSILLFLMQYVPDTTQEKLYEVSRFVGRLIDGEPHENTYPLSLLKKDKKHLRIGFVSADFRKHPVGNLLAAFFRCCDTDKLSLFCYHNFRTGDAITDWYNKMSAGMRNIFGVPDEDVARLIREDQIDILVDLSGHTDGHRLSLFALRQAPVQVTWIGYCHTTGMTSMDYIIAGNDFISVDDEKWFTETVVRLPGNRFCFSQPEPTPDIFPPPSVEKGYITFGCFNNLAKVTPSMIQVWVQILRRVSRSRLVLKSKDFANVEVRNLFHDQFARNGISRNRIELRRHSGYYLMLLEYSDIDIALDPYPFTGGMTSLESLWMGVPVVTMVGELPISRQTKSFLDHVGLQDLVTYSPEEYTSCAVRLAESSVYLSEIRKTLRSRMLMSSLCDAEKYAQSVEKLFFDIWHLKCESEVVSELSQQIKDPREHDKPNISDLETIRRCLQNGKLEVAEKICSAFLDNNPNDEAALVLLGVIQVNQGFLEKGMRCLKKVLSLNPANHIARSKLLFSMNYSNRYSQEDIYCASRGWHCKESATAVTQNVWDQSRFSWPLEEKIRIGFVSQDFRRHSVSTFFEPLIASFDTNRFEIFCYSDVEKPDATTLRIKNYAHVWTDSSQLNDDQLADTIIRDRIGILVDLGGHTGMRTRLPVFFCKPAPVQVSWLGYPNTTGLSAIDYRITDELSDPMGIDQWYTEKLVRLPDGFLCYQPPQDAPSVSELPALANDYITFGCFNMLPKLSVECILLWSRIVNSVPGSRLILKAHSFHDSATCNRITKLFSRAGLDKNRIDLLPTVISPIRHLEIYNEIDIALDTYPYNGTTTTCEALWMGVPVVTLYGARHASRVGMSILSRLGLHELVNETSDDYCDCAVDLAKDYQRLSVFRKQARQLIKRSTLLNRNIFVANMENVFLKMWHDYTNPKTRNEWIS